LQPGIRQIRQAIEHPSSGVPDDAAAVTELNTDRGTRCAEPMIPALGRSEILSGNYIDGNATLAKTINRPEGRVIESLAENEHHPPSAWLGICFA